MPPHAVSRLFLCCLLIWGGLGGAPALADALAPSTGAQHAIAMTGTPALSPGFSRFGYTAGNAPQGGRLVVSELGSFDSFNPFIIRGSVDKRLRGGTNHFEAYVFESLMVRGRDEPFTLYGLIAESIETPDDRSWVAFNIDPAAKFSDGTPITAQDVLFSWETLKSKGQPNHRAYYSKVVRAEALSERRVLFVFKDGSDREMPLIMGLMPILPAQIYSVRDFELATTSELPIGSGPYVIARFDVGKTILYRKNPNYWAKNHPTRRGHFNFNEVRADYYRDSSSMFQAFKAEQIDVWKENEPGRWFNGFDFMAAKQGIVIKRAYPHGRPSGMYGFVYNTRRDIFSDIRVRAALSLPFDFDWVNQNLFHGTYQRTTSFFGNSDLAAVGPASAAERQLLGKYISHVDANILEEGWIAPPSGSPQAVRQNAAQALSLLESAGYVVKNGKLVHKKSGRPFTFEILVVNLSQVVQLDHERIALAYKDSLARLGIEVTVRKVDTAQSEARLNSYDFDMTIYHWGGTLSPGNEQLYRWGSQMAKVESSYNLAGVQNPAVDAAISALTKSHTRLELVTASRVLDRLLLSGYYVVPLFHDTDDLVARWADVEHPGRHPQRGVLFDTWWTAGTN